LTGANDKEVPSPACASEEAVMAIGSLNCSFAVWRGTVRQCLDRGTPVPASRQSRPNRFAASLVWVAIVFAVSFRANTSYGQPQRSIPSAAYFNSFDLLYAGEYREALRAFSNERGIRTVQSRWIDSICIQTMTGECYYKLGQYGEALESYTAALNLYVAFSSWMVQVQFPPAIAPVNRPALPWGRSKRNAKLGRFPAMLISQGQPITESAIRKGGVISAPTLQSIQVAEIVRCTCLAMMRRAELLGPLAKHDPLIEQVLVAAQQRQGVPNHWSQAWLDLQLGFANVAAGNAGQGFALLRQSLVVGGEMDHPITALALLQMGKIALDAGRLQEAAGYLEEASYSAAEAEMPDLMVLEEAFRYGSIIHLMNRPKNVMPALEPAIAWAAKRGGRELQVSLLIQAAENAANVGQTKQAVSLLGQAKTLTGRRIMGTCEIGARLSYVTALAHYQAGAVPVGDEALALALKIYKGFSPWVFQLALASTELAKNNLSPRNAIAIFERLGDDPAPTDWIARPLDCLAVLNTPHHATYEQWFEALRERDMETAFEVADRARRHRFYTALPFGGRLLAVRWLLEAPAASLDEAARLQRQDLLSRYPAYADLAKRGEILRKQLKDLPLIPDKDNTQDHRKQGELLDELSKVVSLQEVILREIAIRREPANFMFPPLRKTKDIQAALPDGTVLLTVFAANRQLYAALLSKSRYASWKIDRADQLENKIAALLRAIGNYDANRELPQTQFTDKSWETAAREAIDAFLKGSKVNFAQNFDELVVVPDGVVWYLPFEAVHVGDGKNTIPLLAKTRVRYAPTMGLALADRSGRLESPGLAVVSGKSGTRDQSPPDDLFIKLQQALPRATLLDGALPAPTPIYGSLLDGLIVLDDVANVPQAPFDWSPIPLDRQKAAGTLANWLALPWKSTDIVVLPGFHTPCENGLKDDANGQDLFMASCALMATGARTVVLSRWRTGGQSSRELVRQFVQELPFSSASQAWQRAVQLVKESPLDIANEPRVRTVPNAPALNGSHPFFWAGYMVLDRGVLPHGQEADPAEPAVIKLEQAPEAKQPPRDDGKALDIKANGNGLDQPMEKAEAGPSGAKARNGKNKGGSAAAPRRRGK
jgi:hypothetical protein